MTACRATTVAAKPTNIWLVGKIPTPIAAGAIACRLECLAHRYLVARWALQVSLLWRRFAWRALRSNENKISHRWLNRALLGGNVF